MTEEVLPVLTPPRHQVVHARLELGERIQRALADWPKANVLTQNQHAELAAHLARELTS